MRKSYILMLLAGLICMSGHVEGKPLNLTCSCSADNDLYTILAKSGQKCARFDTPAEAVEHAAPGSGVLILADGYPGHTTKVDKSIFDRIKEKDLRVYIEYPETLPGLEIGAPQHTTWERGVVSSDAFGDALPKLQIFMIHDCRFVPVTVEKPLLAVARVAGFDTAVFGLPEQAFPILFEMPDRNLIVATTKLSNFVTGRYAPANSWKTIWERILTMLDPQARMALDWEPTVRPAYGAKDKLPGEFEGQAFKEAAKWYHDSRLLVHSSREPKVHQLLKSGAEAVETPGPDAPMGDGSNGILEGYSSALQWDGTQVQRLPLRADCNAETAMVLALDWMVNENSRSRDMAKNLMDYVYFTSGMHGRERGNPKHPAFGHVAWGNIAPAWEVANYSDDDARVMLGTMATAACLGSDKWDESLLLALLANLRTTGTLGFRGDRIDMPELTANGWKPYHDRDIVNYSPHHESYLWACNLWAYKQTGYKPFIERTKNAIRMTMEAYPDGWRWNDSIERGRMILCLAWLVRLEATPEHLKWLDTIADSLIERQDATGAIQELFGGGRHGFQIAASNEEYGTGETPLIQQNGDPASDQLYTTGFALLGFHEAYAATGDPKLKQAGDKLAEYLCRIQTHSEKYPHLNGTWFRAFDYKRWEYWAASGDVGWGAWSLESGWAQAWTAAVLGLRLKSTSLWDLTSDSRIIKQFDKVREQMKQSDSGPWKQE